LADAAAGGDFALYRGVAAGDGTCLTMKALITIFMVAISIAVAQARDDTSRAHEVQWKQQTANTDKGDTRRTAGGVGHEFAPAFVQQLMDEFKKILKGDVRRVRD
jgi:hypothetical protein